MHPYLLTHIYSSTNVIINIMCIKIMYNGSLSSRPRSTHVCELLDLGYNLSIPIIHMRHSSSPILGTTIGPTRSYGTDPIP